MNTPSRSGRGSVDAGVLEYIVTFENRSQTHSHASQYHEYIPIQAATLTFGMFTA